MLASAAGGAANNSVIFQAQVGRKAVHIMSKKIQQAFIESISANEQQQAEATAAMQHYLDLSAQAQQTIDKFADSACIQITRPTIEHVLSVNQKADTRTVSDGIDYLDHTACVSVFCELGKAGHSIDRAVASTISDFLIDRGVSQSQADDGKVWRAIKAECEAVTRDEANAPLLKFPQQWENYFSCVKRAISLGYNVMALQGLDSDGIKRVTSRSQLLSYIKANRPDVVKATLEERTCTSLESIAELLADDDCAIGSEHLSETAKQAVRDLAAACLSDYDLQVLADKPAPSAEDVIRDLLDDGHADLMQAMLAAYLAQSVKTGTHG